MAAGRVITNAGARTLRFVGGGILDPLNIFIVLALCIHIIDVIAFGFNPMNPARWFMHTFLALLAWLWVFNVQGESKLYSLVRYLLIGLLAVFFVYIGNWVAHVTGWLFGGMEPAIGGLLPAIAGGITNTIFVPVWMYYAIFFQDIRSPTRVSKLIAFIFLLFFIIAAFTAASRSKLIPSSFEEISPEQREQARAVAGDVLVGVGAVRNAAPAAAQGIWQGFTGTIRDVIMGPHGLVASAVGEDIYASQVDKNKDEPLGVYLENLQPASEEFYEDEPVSVWATLKARTLDPDDNISVTISCSADPGQLGSGMACPVAPKVNGDTNPDPAVNTITFTIFGFEQQDIGCTIQSNKLLHGFRAVTFNADFNFRTDAYLKAYFMETSRLRALRRENIDPLDLYGISDKTPIAVHSNGPVAVGMITTQPLMGIDENTTFRLGVSLNNRWEGQIARISNVVLKIPEAMEIRPSDCDISFVKRACDDRHGECEGGKYQNVYELNDTRLRQLTNIKTAKSFNCNVRVKPGRLDVVLGNVPLMTHYFKAAVEYNYELEKAISVNVKHPPDKPGVEPPGVSCMALANIPSQYEYLFSQYTSTGSEEELITTVLDNYGYFIDEAVAANPSVPKALIVAFIIQESGGNPYAVSSAGAVGLMQLMPHTSKAFGNTRVIDPDDQLDDVTFDKRPDIRWSDYSASLQGYIQGKIPEQLAEEDLRFDPRQNIFWGTAYLASLLRTFNNDFYKVAAGYNAGSGKVNEWMANGQWESFTRSGYQCANSNCDNGQTQRQILSIASVQNYVNKIIATFKLVDSILNPGRQGTVTPGAYAWPLDPSQGKHIADCFSNVDVPGGRIHYGTDIPAPEGSDAIAIADGVVQAVCGHPTTRCDLRGTPACTAENSCGGQGNFIEVRTDQNWYYRYMHLSQELVTPNARVSKGQVIGKVGNTGRSMGSHIHMETYSSTSRRRETAFNMLCLYDARFLAQLSFEQTADCAVLTGGSTTLSPGSPTYQQQCMDMEQILTGIT